MFWLIFIALLVVPTIELWGLITVGGWIGAWPTIVIVFSTAIIGGWLARNEGTQAFRLAQIQIANGDPPGEAILDGLSILIGAILLFIPGFFTDLMGFLLLIPFSRAFVKTQVKRWLEKKLTTGSFQITWFGSRRR